MISGIHGHGPGDAGPFSHAAAELGWQVVLDPAQTHELELDPGHDVDGGLLELGVLAQRQRHVVGDRQRVEEGRALKAHPHLASDLDPFVVGHGREVLAVDQNPPGPRTHQTDQVSEQGGLAGTAAAEDHEDLARLGPRS